MASPRRPVPLRDAAGLKAALDALYEAYNREAFGEAASDASHQGEAGAAAKNPSGAAKLRLGRTLDPVQFVHRFDDPADQEVVGFIAAGLAFGRVASVMQSVGRVVTELGPRPARFVRQFHPSTARAPFESLGHRWTRGPDLVALLWLLRQIVEQAGSLEAFFLQGYDAAAPDIQAALESFSTRAMGLDLGTAYGRIPARPGVAYFFPKPSCGSGCKRLNLYLRWMVRCDGIDVGAWTRIPPSKLIVPLDVHVVRLGQCLGLTRHVSAGWKMAQEITASLRALDPNDPARYDFALCHVGMRDECGFRRPFSDSRCPLRGFCRPRGRRRPASRPPSGRR